MEPAWECPQFTTELGMPPQMRLMRSTVRAREPEELALDLGHHDTLKLTLKCRFRLSSFNGQG